MRDIAAAAEVAYQTLYNYFPSKAQIGLALLVRDAAGIEPALDHDGDVLEALGSLTGSIVGFVTECDRELWREVLVETVGAAQQGVVRQLDPSLGERLRGLLSGAQHRGALDAYLDTEAMAMVIESILDTGVVAWAVAGEYREGDLAEGELAKEALAARVDGQVVLVVGPYLRGAL